MKKISWPYFQTLDEDDSSANMGSMEASGDPDRDIEMYSNVYQTLVPEVSVLEEGQEPAYGYEEGMFSPVNDKDYDDIYCQPYIQRHFSMVTVLLFGTAMTSDALAEPS